MERNIRLELELGGKVRPLLFDFAFLDFLVDEIPLTELDQIGATRPWQMFPHLALAALKSGIDFEGQKPPKDLTYKTVAGWCQQADPADLNKLLEGYKGAMGFIGLALSGKGAESQNQ